MSPSPNKAQLNVRVPPEVREAALERSRSLGKSLNAYIEHLIRADTHVNHVADHARLVPGQMSWDEATDGLPDPPGRPQGPQPPADPVDTAKRFDPSCVAAVYHWKNSPGNPCRSCGGEI